MRIKKKSGYEEKMILSAMVTDEHVLSRIVTKWDKNLFGHKWSNLIATWCVKYYGRYKKAPKKHMQSIFYNWAQKTNDEKLYHW